MHNASEMERRRRLTAAVAGLLTALCSPSPARAAGTDVVEPPGLLQFERCWRPPRRMPKVKFNLPPGSELRDLITWISDIGCTQVIAPAPLLDKKKVTIYAPRWISVQEAYRLFLAALDSLGLTVEPQGKFLRVVETARARFTGLPLVLSGERLAAPGKAYVTRLFRFEHLDPTVVLAQLFNHLRGEKGAATAFGGVLIATDRADMLERFAGIVAELDRPEVVRSKIWMLRVKSSSARDMAHRLAQIFDVGQLGGQVLRARSPAPPPPRPAPPPRPGQPAPPRRSNPSAIASMLTVEKIIPEERTNQLLVVADEPVHELLLTILRRLDVAAGQADHDLVHVYRCEHAECDQVASTLGAITGVPVMGAVVRAPARAARPRAPAPRRPLPAGVPPTGALLPPFDREVRITVDPATNALIVVSSLSDFEAFRRLAQMLDVPRKQVYIEATILEVLLDRSRELAVAYHGGRPLTAGGSQAIALGGFDPGKTLNPASLATDLVGLAGAVFGPAQDASATRLLGVTTDLPSFGAFIKLLQKNNDVDVLSAPRLLITNNQEGEIAVGQRLPFPGGFLGGLPGGAPGTTGSVGPLLPGVSVQREDVSLRLKLAPSVNEGDQIRLQVDIEISDLASPNFNGLGPATSKRTVKTPVVCRDQQTIVLGGLLADRLTETQSKIPILGDIPVLGFFFRRTSRQVQKSNIIVALTPYVITDVADLRRVAEQKMRERREFIERVSASPDLAELPASTRLDRRNPGMLERINRAARDIDREEQQMRRIRERELQDESAPIEISDPAARSRTRPVSGAG
jgi:general secretion pathway protein D